MDQKTALLAVSFGTSHLDTLEKNIEAIEKVIFASLPSLTGRRAFTSSIIMKKLLSRDHIQIDNVPQALEKLLGEGYTQVVIQPTHIINGEEYNKLCRQTVPFEDRLSLTIGTPLLTSVQDYKDVSAALMKSLPAPSGEEALILMGHGTAHCANSAYALLEYMLHEFGWEQVFIGTVEGYPELTQVISHLKKYPAVRKVNVHPLMVVAGDHANHDMAGPDEDSWKNQLRAQGYEVNCIIKGLGEYPAVRELFAAHAAEAYQKLAAEKGAEA